jgi:hypothetical protein
MSILCVLLFVVVCGVAGHGIGVKGIGVGDRLKALDPTSLPMPKFVVNLDSPPKERWNTVAEVYSEQMLVFFQVAI